MKIWPRKGKYLSLIKGRKVKGFSEGFTVKKKIIPAMQETQDTRDVASVSGSGSRRSPGRGNSNPLQYSCLGIPTYRGGWRATVHGVAKSQTVTEQQKES